MGYAILKKSHYLYGDMRLESVTSGFDTDDYYVHECFIVRLHNVMDSCLLDCDGEPCEGGVVFNFGSYADAANFFYEIELTPEELKEKRMREWAEEDEDLSEEEILLSHIKHGAVNRSESKEAEK